MAQRAKKCIRQYNYSQQKSPDKYNRVRSMDYYHTYRWTRESKAFREMNPLCAICEKEGILTPSEVTDHIIPASICDDFFDQSNWQALCKKCNILKGNRDKLIISSYEKKRMDRT